MSACKTNCFPILNTFSLYLSRNRFPFYRRICISGCIMALYNLRIVQSTHSMVWDPTSSLHASNVTQRVLYWTLYLWNYSFLEHHVAAQGVPASRYYDCRHTASCTWLCHVHVLNLPVSKTDKIYPTNSVVTTYSVLITQVWLVW